jgi:hypothetical protein
MSTATAIRNEKIGRLQGLRRALRLDDDTYRDKLEQITGKRSAADLDAAGLDAAIKGFQPFHVKQKVNNAYARKVLALWIAAYNLGVIDNGSDAALDAFVERQTGKQLLRFIGPDDANKITEALKPMLERAGGFVVPANDAGGMEARRRLVRAQWKMLIGFGRVSAAEGAIDGFLVTAIQHRPGGTIDTASQRDLDLLAKRLGKMIRGDLRKRRTA